MKAKILFVTIFSIAACCFFGGCGGNSPQTKLSTPTINTQQPSWPVARAMSEGSLDGIIAVRTGSANYDSGSINLISSMGTKEVTQSADWYGSMKWSPKGNLLASLGNSNKLVLMDRSGNVIVNGDGCDDQFNWLNDGSGILTGNETGIALINTSGRATQLVNAGGKCINPAITRDGKYIYFLKCITGGCDLYKGSSSVILAGTSLDKCEKLCEFPTDSGERVQLEALPNGRVIIAYQSTLWLFDPVAKKMVDSGFSYMTYMKLSPDGKQLLVVGSDIKIVDTETFAVKVSAPKPPSGSGYYSFGDGTWFPDGKSLALYTYHYQVNQAVYVWNSESNSLFKVFECPYPTRSGTRAYGEQSVSISCAP